jgi:hypothetical protein
MPLKAPKKPKQIKYPEFELNIPLSHSQKKSNRDIVRYKPKFDFITLLEKYNKKVNDPARALKFHIKEHGGYFQTKYIDPINKTGKTVTIESLSEAQRVKKVMNAKLRDQKQVISNFKTTEKYSTQLQSNKRRIELHTTALFKILKEADVFKNENYNIYKKNLEKELLQTLTKISDFNTIGYDEFSRKLLHQFTHEYSVKCGNLVNHPNFPRLTELINWLRRLNPVLEKTVESRMSRVVRSQLNIPFSEEKEQ